MWLNQNMEEFTSATLAKTRDGSNNVNAFTYISLTADIFMGPYLLHCV